MTQRTSDNKRTPAAPEIPRYDAKELTQGGDQAEITLGEQAYWLRITKAGKLILTK